MPRRSVSAVSAASARVRRFQDSLPDLSAPALLRVRAALDLVLAGDRVRVADVEAVLAAAEDG